MTIPPSLISVAPGAKHRAPAAWSRICLATGGVLLAAGCYLGSTTSGSRAWSLMLLLLSVVLFAIAGGLEFRNRVTSTADKVAGGLTVRDHVAATPSAKPIPPSRVAADPVQAKSPVTALAVVAPPPGPAMPTKAAPDPAPNRAETPLDVATLIKVPLNDLLLAALCKDPQGARRIFANALLQTDPGVPSVPVAQAHTVTQPASDRGP